MGKNNNKKKPNDKHTVSIITITQVNRFEFLEILFGLIKNQTYSNIIEWVIVEGSKNELDAHINKENINNMICEKQSEVNFIIKYIEKKKRCKTWRIKKYW